MRALTKSRLFLLASLVLAVLVFLKNAWVAEDAYIIFRTIEQLFVGNGLVWNPHERVQVYTSPLWCLVLVFARVFSSDQYLNVIVVSFCFWLLTVFVLKKLFIKSHLLFVSIMLLSASSSFFDFTSSGLENVLGYCVIAAYILGYSKVFAFEVSQERLAFLVKMVLFLFGLIICVRHDLGVLLFPSVVYLFLKNRRVLSLHQWIKFGFLALLPFVTYTLVSLFYYGFPFPNTAYAKLNTGIDKLDILRQGASYFYATLENDVITLLMIFLALIVTFLRASGVHHKYLACGVVLDLIYIAYIGGDFMQGRFFSYAYFVSIILLLLAFSETDETKVQYPFIALVFLYVTYYPNTPFNTSINYSDRSIKNGIANERAFYFNKLSLISYVLYDTENKLFPSHIWAREGYEFKIDDSVLIVETGTIGMFGYFSGTEKIIVDTLALSDPLLARIPVTGGWRIGHFKRAIPPGYYESLAYDSEVIVDPELNEFYTKLKILTQSDDLFSWERLKTIVMFNVGAYNYLLEK